MDISNAYAVGEVITWAGDKDDKTIEMA